MSDSLFGLIELVLVFGSVLGFGFYQLWSLKRDKQKARLAGEQEQKQKQKKQDTDEHR